VDSYSKLYLDKDVNSAAPKIQVNGCAFLNGNVSVNVANITRSTFPTSTSPLTVGLISHPNCPLVISNDITVTTNDCSFSKSAQDVNGMMSVSLELSEVFCTTDSSVSNGLTLGAIAGIVVAAIVAVIAAVLFGVLVKNKNKKITGIVALLSEVANPLQK